MSKPSILAEMGIKPVWRLREGMMALQSAPAISEPIHSQQSVSELDWNGLEQAGAVLGSGDRQAEWLFIGAHDLGGSVGLLLDAMLGAISLQRGKNVYLAHAQMPAAGACPYLARQIALVSPKVLVVFGAAAAQNLLGQSVSDAHGKVLRYGELPVIVCDHPADLLRQPMLKANAWAALCLAMDQLAVSEN